jgi:hypothetical protein
MAPAAASGGYVRAAASRNSLNVASTTLLVAVIVCLIGLNVVAFSGAFEASDENAVPAVPERLPSQPEPAFREPPPAKAVKGARSPSNRTPKAVPPAPALPRFEGEHFAIDYPRGWRIETAEEPVNTYLDTTIRAPQDPRVYLRVDVTPGRGGAPAEHAAEVEGYLVGQDGYRRIALDPTRLGRAEALRWVFEVRERSVLLRKVDVFLTDPRGNRIAMLTQAPAALYARYEPLFARIRSSLTTRA